MTVSMQGMLPVGWRRPLSRCLVDVDILTEIDGGTEDMKSNAVSTTKIIAALSDILCSWENLMQSPVVHANPWAMRLETKHWCHMPPFQSLQFLSRATP